MRIFEIVQMTKIARSIFGLTCMNAVKVDQNAPLFESVASAAKAASADFEYDQWRHAALKYLNP